MVTEEVNVVKELFLCFLKRCVHQQRDHLCLDFKIVGYAHYFVEGGQVFVVLLIKIVIFVQKLDDLQKFHQTIIAICFLLK